eukprot:Skav233210  [mRNA]  locus=scaffold2657:4014:5081:- [translate_table: standard]
MEVCFLTSGETLAVLDTEERSAKTLKQRLAARLGVSRFRQRLFLEGDSREISDDEVLASIPAKVQLVVLDFWPPDAEQYEAMFKALSENDLETLNKLLQSPINPNIEDEDGRTLLNRVNADLTRSIESVKLLLEAGAVVEQTWNNCAFLLIHAASLGDVELAQLLLEAAAPDRQRWVQQRHRSSERSCQNCQTAASSPCSAGAVAARRRRRHISRNTQWELLRTPLFAAAVDGHVEIACLLLEWRADPEQVRPNGQTPLLATTYRRQVGVSRVLIEAGAALHLDVVGVELLQRAAELHDTKLIKLLLERRVAPNQAAQNGRTALSCAEDLGHVKIVRLLNNAGAVPDPNECEFPN